MTAEWEPITVTEEESLALIDKMLQDLKRIQQQQGEEHVDTIAKPRSMGQSNYFQPTQRG